MADGQDKGPAAACGTTLTVYVMVARNGGYCS
jgi:hypothetical protein